MAAFWHVLRQGLALDLDLWRGVVADPASFWFGNAVLVVVLAGLAEAVAQSAVLFMNQVKPRRFLISLLVNAFLFTFGYFFYVLSISVVAGVVYGERRDTTLVLTSVALAYAPLVLGFLTLIPYFGRAIAMGLSAFHFLALLIAVSVTYGVTGLQPVICVAGGWLLLTLLRGTIGRPVTALARFARNRFAGTQLLDAQAIQQRYRERSRHEEEP